MKFYILLLVLMCSCGMDTNRSNISIDLGLKKRLLSGLLCYDLDSLSCEELTSRYELSKYREVKKGHHYYLLHRHLHSGFLSDIFAGGGGYFYTNENGQIDTIVDIFDFYSYSLSEPSEAFSLAVERGELDDGLESITYFISGEELKALQAKYENNN